MSRFLLLASLLGCNQWVRPSPPTARTRGFDLATDMAVLVEVLCRTGSLEEGRAGSGVIVSDWQVLTSYHLVDCPSIPSIWVTTKSGTWRFTPERDWMHADVSRIQIASSDVIRVPNRPVISPPVVGPVPPYGHYVSTHAALPSWGVWEGRMLSPYKGQGQSTSQGLDGMSGAGVYDIQGRLVGIHSAAWDTLFDGRDGSLFSPIEPGMVPQ